MLKMVISGSKGRMGNMLSACVANHKDVVVIGGVDIGDTVQAFIGETDVVVDFSIHTATLELAKVCAENHKAMVIGTTGHSPEVRSKVVEVVRAIPVVWTTNFSVGVNVLFDLTRKAAELLDPDFDLEVIEMHHRLKKDAPSGTAETLFQILSEVRNRQFSEKVHSRQRGGVYKRPGRQGNMGERDSSEIGMHAIRGGDVVGEHTVIFAGNGERLELTHKASSRENFANGALRAAQWVVGKKPGLYTMQEVLGLV